MPKTALRRKPEKAPKLGKLPEWDLSDLYAGLDNPEIKSDLERGDRDCAAFEQAFKGRLGTMVSSEGGGRSLAEAIKQYEAIDDRIGRLMSYACLSTSAIPRIRSVRSSMATFRNALLPLRSISSFLHSN